MITLNLPTSTRKEVVNLISVFGIKVNLVAEQSVVSDAQKTNTSEVKQQSSAVSMGSNMSDKPDGSYLTVIPAILLDGGVRQEKRILEEQLVKKIKSGSPEQLEAFASQLGCVNAIKQAISVTGTKSDTLFAIDSEAWKTLALPVILAKREEKRSASPYKKGVDPATMITTADVIKGNVGNFYQIKFDEPDERIIKSKLKSGLVYLLYLKKSTWSISSFSVTRNMTVLDKLYGKGVVGASMIYDWVKSLCKKEQDIQDGKEPKKSANTEGLIRAFSTDGQFNPLSPWDSFRNIAWDNVCRLWVADANEVKGREGGNTRSEYIWKAQGSFAEDDLRCGLVLKPSEENADEFNKLSAFAEVFAEQAYINGTWADISKKGVGLFMNMYPEYQGIINKNQDNFYVEYMFEM